MEVPKNLKRVKPNQVVVLDRHYEASWLFPNSTTTTFNALAITDDGTLMMFDTNHYKTEGKVEFYGE